MYYVKTNAHNKERTMKTKTAKKTTTKTTKKTATKTTKKPVKKAPTKATKAPKHPFSGWQFEIDVDGNFPDNLNVSFTKPLNAAWTKADTTTLQPLIDQLGIDPEPMMDGLYSFDALTRTMVEPGLIAAGMTVFVPEEVDLVADFHLIAEPLQPAAMRPVPISRSKKIPR